MDLLLVAFTAFVAIFIAFYTKPWKNLSKRSRVIVVLSVALAILSGVNGSFNIWNDRRINEIKADIGKIKSISGVTIPGIQTGYKGGKFLYTNNIFIIDNDNRSFGIYIKNNKLFVSAIIRDNEGKVIATIDKNEWKVYNTSDYEYNNDDTAFEIVSRGEHNVYFRVELIKEWAHIFGFFVSKNGRGLYIDDQGLWHFFSDKKINIDPWATPIFKYPREQFFGQRINEGG